MKVLNFVIVSFLLTGIVYGQEAEIQRWQNLPKLQLEKEYSLKSGESLPYKVSSFDTKYFRPLFNQYGWSCNQASSIGYLLTYELNSKRDVPGNTPENQCAPLFVFNYLNDGVASHGVSYFDTWEIVKLHGCANYVDFPNNNNEKRWLTGYDKYQRAMSNRIIENYSIDVSTAEGIEILKRWLYDRGNGSDNGGLANFQIGSGGMEYRTLPQNTEEGGSRVIVSFGFNVGHAMTIVGYNDSIRLDLNNDLRYTNHIDINGDGIVNVKDWEIGGVQFVNSWGFHEKSFIMYNVLAKSLPEGGIWGNSVHVVKVNAFYEPLLTMKVKMKYNARNKLKIMAGVATDTSSAGPEFIHEFPAYNYTGGSRPMQGENTIEAETIEFGLDITPLLAKIEPGIDAKYFLMINEKDSADLSNGKIISFSVIDYQNGENEIKCELTDYPIVDNGTTLMPVVKSVDFNKLEITTDGLPPALPNEAFSYQLEADGGTPPYSWAIDIGYDESHREETFPESDSEALIDNNNYRMVAVDLDFSFPYYGEEFNRLFVLPNGLLAFYKGFAEYPYMVNPDLLFKTRKYLKVFGDKIEIHRNQGDFVKSEGDENSATFIWNASVDNEGNIADVNVAIRIYPSGEIEYCYGEINMNLIPWNSDWEAGFSNGDCVHTKTAKISNSDFLFEDYVVKFTPRKYPENFQISETGVISCVPSDSVDIININVLVTDSKNISSSKIVSFSTIDWDDSVILAQNAPNPFTNLTRIKFLIQKQGDVLIEIYDMTGRRVNTLLDQNLLAGEYDVVWRAYGRNELPLKTGMYICRLKFGDTIKTKKMFRIK